MASNRRQTFGPIALTATLTTNIFNPAAAGAGTGYTPTASYALVRHIRVINKDSVARTVSLWKGLTGANTAGTEFLFTATSVPAPAAGVQNWVEAYGEWRFDAADFLVGGASAATALTIEFEGEIGLA